MKIKKINEVKCKVCSKIKQHQAKGMCHNCYIYHGTPKVTCKGCGKLKNHWAKGHCSNCFKKTFHYDRIKASNAKRDHKIGLDLYNHVTKSCFICGFDKAVDLHHLDRNHSNNKPENLIGLCPNHHKMLHMEKYVTIMELKIHSRLKGKGPLEPFELSD
jgi:RecJ-like exonuclease